MNHHPKIRCPYCNARVRWNPSNLKLFNHNSDYDYKNKCKYGGKSILNWYYEKLDYAKKWEKYCFGHEIDDSYFSTQYHQHLRIALESKIKWFIENDKITIKF